MPEQLTLALDPRVDFIDAHDLTLRVGTATIDPDDFRCIMFMRRYKGESPDVCRCVWVMSPHVGGQVRMFVLADGELRHVPDRRGEWPELDDAVAARLGASIFAEVTWDSNGGRGPVENWRLAC